MEKWEGKVAVVTGASSGIGKAISQCLVSHGVTVIGVARRLDVLKKIADEQKGKKGKFYPKMVDLHDESQIVALFQQIDKKLGGVSILVNSAVDWNLSSLTDGKTADWKSMLQTQTVALSVCTREAIRSMKRAVNDGVIIHINSVVGHYIPHIKMPAMYTVAKHGITVLTEVLRRELAEQKLSNIKVTSLSPGFTKTEKIEAIPTFSGKPLLDMSDVCEAMVFILSAPPHLEISELTLRAHGSEF